MKLLEMIAGKSFEEIKALFSAPPYSLLVKDDGPYYLLKYNQIESDMSQEVVRECRGIILRKDNNKVVCHPFDRFFNYGEVHAAEIDWSSARVQDKLDGSIIKVWYDDNEWHVSTNGVIDAKKAINPIDLSFYSMFIEGLQNAIQEPDVSFEEFCMQLNPEYTYMFEMTHPANRMVVRYEIPMIYHIGTRNNASGEEYKVYIGIPQPQEYKFNNLDEVIKIAENLKYDKEGYVIVDNAWHRIKVKSPAHLAAHNLKNNGMVTYKRILELILKGSTEEFLSYFPEFTDYFNKAMLAYTTYLSAAQTSIEKIRHNSYASRKEFAADAIKTVCPDFCFKVYDLEYKWDDFPAYTESAGSERLAKILRLKDQAMTAIKADDENS